jgi:hypothetical protein
MYLPNFFRRTMAMFWELCIKYANGTEKVLDIFQDLEIAQNRVDKLYSEGYPMHFAYVVRPSSPA